MKNVCFLIGNLNNSGGTERVTTLVANELSKRGGHTISILSLVDGLTPFFSLNENIKIYSLYKRKISFKRNFFGAIWSIRRFVTEHNIHTLIVVDSISCVFTVPALWLKGINHICWEHFNFKNDNNVKFRKVGREWAAKYCNYIVTLTSRDKIFWQEGLNNIDANLINIPNPTSYENNSYSADINSKIVLAVGRLTKVKGFDLLIKTWEKVCKNNKEWTLYIVGGGPEEEGLRKLAEELKISDRIIFTGMTSDVSKYYMKSSLFCLSSRNEGLPMVLLEAQSYGLPIVSFDCDTGPSDLVEHNVNGFLVPPEDISSMQYYLEKAMSLDDSKYSEMVNASIKNIGKFSIQNVVNEWCEII